MARFIDMGATNMKKQTLALLTLLFSASLYAQPAAYSYYVYVLPPFGKVIINNSITCPNGHGERCLVESQQVNSSLIITGIKNHICKYNVNADGSVTKDEASSYFCDGGYTVSASTGSTGEIHLPKHF